MPPCFLFCLRSLAFTSRLRCVKALFMLQAFHEVVRAMKQRWTTTEIISGKSDLSALNRMVRTIAASNLSSNDQQILEAAKIAEALATTMYTNIVKGAPFFRRLSRFDQSYFRAAREVEMEHYRLLKSATGTGTPIARFYFPQRMFVDAKVTLDTLVTLEEAFVAAYIVGVRDLSNDTLKVIAARIMGVESDHRTLGRVVAQEIDPRDGGPFDTLRGLAGEEPVEPPNNNAYERTYRLRDINDAVNALLPFIDRSAAQAAGFSLRPFQFEPFEPTLPSPFGGLDG